MDSENAVFRNENVDEQIEELASASLLSTQQTTPNMRVVRNLYSVYEDMNTPSQMNRSLERIWERLADHIVETTEPTETSEIDEEIVPAQDNSRIILLRPQTPNRISWRRTLALSIAVAVVLANILGWSLLAHFMRVSSLTGQNGTPSVSIHATPTPTLKEQADQLLHAFQQEVTSWGLTHRYHDIYVEMYNGKGYPLDYSYGQQGIGQDAQNAVQNARTQADYQAAIDLINNDYEHLRAMEANYSDQAQWNVPHASDMQLLSRYKLTSGRVIVVSLVEQALRVYQNGKLVKAFLITTGRFESPTPPGLWQILYRASPMILKATVPKSSPFWFPDTRVNYAMEFRSGYFIHDSSWRALYGPGTEFPQSTGNSGTSTSSNNGSIGTINMAENAADWLYHNTSNGDRVVIY